MTKLLSYFVCHMTQVKHHWYICLFLCCRENEDCLVKCQSWRKLAVTGRQDDLQAGSCAVRPSKHGCEMCVRSFLFCLFFLFKHLNRNTLWNILFAALKSNNSFLFLRWRSSTRTHPAEGSLQSRGEMRCFLLIIKDINLSFVSMSYFSPDYLFCVS